MAKGRRKKRKLRIDRIVMLVCIILIIGLGIYFIITKFNSKSDKSDSNLKPNIEDTPKKYEASLVMVGDNLIHSSVYKDANKNANYNGYDFKPMYTYIKNIVKDYDLAYYNQETILGGEDIGLSDYPAFNSPYEVGDAMIDAGFNLVSLATNHTMDRGEKAILNSFEYWKGKDGIMTAGSYSSFEERNKVNIMEKNNISYTLLSYTYGTNGIAVPKGKEYLVNVWPTDFDINDPERDNKYQEYKKTVKEDIDRVRDKVDLLMVAMHWGTEYTHTPTAYEKDMAEYLSSLGVDIVIGSHPHVVQPITWINDTLVIYSLGNFISAQETNMDFAKMVGLMSSLNITKTVKGSDVKVEISDVKNELLFTSYKNWRNFKVVPFSSPDIGNYLSDYQRVYNKYAKVISNLDDTMTVNALSN